MSDLQVQQTAIDWVAQDIHAALDVLDAGGVDKEVTQVIFESANAMMMHLNRANKMLQVQQAMVVKLKEQRDKVIEELQDLSTAIRAGTVGPAEAQKIAGAAFEDGCLAATESMVYDLAYFLETTLGIDSSTAHHAAVKITSFDADLDEEEAQMPDEAKELFRQFIEVLGRR